MHDGMRTKTLEKDLIGPQHVVVVAVEMLRQVFYAPQQRKCIEQVVVVSETRCIVGMGETVKRVLVFADERTVTRQDNSGIVTRDGKVTGRFGYIFAESLLHVIAICIAQKRALKYCPFCYTHSVGDIVHHTICDAKVWKC